MSKVAVVTGSNKGIGFGIVRALCKQFKGDVYLTSRDVRRGELAVNCLEKEGICPKFYQLDITDKSSIERLRHHLEVNYGGVDVLVNNAGILFKNTGTVPFYEEAELTMKTNYSGVVDMCNALFPILKPGARVVHVSSEGSTSVMKNVSKEIFDNIKAASTVDDVTILMNGFLTAAKSGKHKDIGWVDTCYTAYETSKVGVTVIASIQQQVFDKDQTKPDIVVNACCPGYVDTDMSSHKGHLTIDQGADTPVYLALLPVNSKSPRGEFVRERKVYNWRKGDFP